MTSEMSEKDKIEYLAKEIVRLAPSSRGIFTLVNVLFEIAVGRAANVERKRELRDPITGENELETMLGNSALSMLVLMGKYD